MTRLLFLLLTTLVVFSSCTNENRLYRIQENGLYGFIDSLGNVVIEPQYRYVSPFTKDGYACVISNIKIEEDTKALPLLGYETGKDSVLIVTYGYINNANELAIDTINRVKIPFMNVNDWGGTELIESAHMYLEGKLKFRTNILNELALCDGLFIYQDENSGLFGYKDINGNIKIDAKYSSCRYFNDGAAIVRFKRGANVDFSEMLNCCGVINTAGDSVFSGYTMIQDFRNDGMTWALTTSISEERVMRDWVQIDKKGSIKTGPIPNVHWIYNSKEYPICVIDMGFIGTFYTFLDEKGDFLSDFNNDKELALGFGKDSRSELFKDVTRFSDRVAGIKGYNDNGQSAWYFVERNFIPMSEPYDSLLPFSEGLAAVKELTFIGEQSSHWGKWGFVKMQSSDSTIVQAIPFSFSECGSFAGGLAYFMNEGSTFNMEGFVNHQGKIVWQTKRKKE